MAFWMGSGDDYSNWSLVEYVKAPLRERVRRFKSLICSAFWELFHGESIRQRGSNDLG
jgi:hypothetical protein